MQLTYVGHATVLLETEGRRILTDPMLRNRVTHLTRRPSPVDPAWYNGLDAVLISHLHWDHFDTASLRLLNHKTRFIVPLGTAPLLEKLGFRHVEEVNVGEQTNVGPLTITATYAEHGRSRLPFGRSAPCLGFLINGGHTTYFPGDTDLFPEMTALAPQPIDLALLPVWGWGPTLGNGHMTPQRAAEALTLLRPRLAIPIHWGTYHPIGMGWLDPEFMRVPPHTFVTQAAFTAPQVKTFVVAPGEGIDLTSWVNGTS